MGLPSVEGLGRVWELSDILELSDIQVEIEIMTQQFCIFSKSLDAQQKPRHWPTSPTTSKQKQNPILRLIKINPTSPFFLSVSKSLLCALLPTPANNLRALLCFLHGNVFQLTGLICCAAWIEIERFKCEIFLRYLFLFWSNSLLFSSSIFVPSISRRHHDLPISCIGGTEQLKITLNCIWSLKRGLRHEAKKILLLSALRLLQLKIEFFSVGGWLLFPSVDVYCDGCCCCSYLDMGFFRELLMLKLWHCWCDLNT